MFGRDDVEVDRTAPRVDDVETDESGAPVPDDRILEAPIKGPNAVENPLLDEDEMARFVREGLEAWDKYDKDATAAHEEYVEGGAAARANETTRGWWQGRG